MCSSVKKKKENMWFKHALTIEKSGASTIKELYKFLQNVSKQKLKVKGLTPEEADDLLVNLGISTLLANDNTLLRNNPATSVLFERGDPQLIPEKTEWKELSIGDKGLIVTSINRKLRDLGFYNNDPVGNFDKNTEKAVKGFQSAHMPTVRGKRKYNKYGSIDDKTSKTIDKQYEIFKARGIYGLPGLGYNTIKHLKKAGIHHLQDVKKIDFEKLPKEVKIPKRIADQLRVLSEISRVTGLTPENAYALNKFGGIINEADYKALTEIEIKDITKKARKANLLSDSSLYQLEFHRKKLEQESH